MSAQIFRRAVHDGGRAQIEWPREERRGKGVVDEKGHAALARRGADRLDVRHAAQGVRDGLGDDEPGA